MFCPKCDSERVIRLPYQSEVVICPDCKARWMTKEKIWSRDIYGEAQWAKMASYVNKSYDEVLLQEYEYCLSKLSAV